MNIENFFKSKNRDTEIYTDVRDTTKGKLIGQLIDKLRYEKDFDIVADVRRNAFVIVCIDKQEFRLMLFPSLEQAENFGIGRGNIIEPISIKLTETFDLWKKEQIGYVVVGNDGQNEAAQNVH